MARFTYVAKDKNGNTKRDVIDEISQQAVVDSLQRQGLFVVKVKEIAKQSISKKDAQKKKKFARKKYKNSDLLVFGRQLATMLTAGVTLVRSLDVITMQVQSSDLHKVLTQVQKDVEGGKSLSSALAQHPKVFNQFWISLIEVGEASGTIPTVLEKLAFYIEQQEAFKSAIISGIIYPAILFMVTVGALFFFAYFIGPRFEAIFKTMGIELPLITRIVLGVFGIVKNNLLFILGGAGLFVFGLKKYAKTYSGRLNVEKVLFKMPAGFGDTYRNIIVERFSSQMAILVDSGVPILQALNITEKLVDNGTCALVVSDIRDGVKQGELLVGRMEKSGFFPSMAVQMVMVGEETGELTKMLKHVAAYFQDHVETFMKRFAVIFEPIMLIFMGGVIGIIVIAMFMPMLQMAQAGG